MTEAIAHYRLLDHIGTGGLGEVYRGRDTKLGRTVAVSVLPEAIAADAERLEGVLQAARLAAGLSHPNIAALFDVGDAASRYLAFEFVPGTLLSATLGGRPLDVRRAVDFAIQLADALAEAEGHGIVHGDIRPDTIMITPKDRPKLLHFGLAAFTAGERTGRATAAPLHSPEAITADWQDPRSDIRALGLVMYEMLTGRQPVWASGAEPPSPGAINPTVPSEVDVVVRKMLSRDLEKRYQAAATVAAELRAVAAILDVRSAAAGATLNPARAPQRRRSIATIAVLTALVTLAFWIWRNGVTLR